MAARKIIKTQVAVMGAGPAGLMLSHLLARAGIESTVIEIRSRQEISETVRAGILEHGTVNMLVNSGVSDRLLREGDRHDGIELLRASHASSDRHRTTRGDEELRVPIVDEAALKSALRAGSIAGAGLDVYEHEPRVHPELLELDNVALLPHLGSATVETRTGSARAGRASRDIGRVCRLYSNVRTGRRGHGGAYSGAWRVKRRGW